MFVGKNTQLKQAAVNHAIMQAGRSRTVIASLQICLGVQLHIEFGSRFFIETLHELGFCPSYQKVQKYQQSAAVSQPLETPCLMPGQFMADNLDHNSEYTNSRWSKHISWYGDDKSCHSWYWMYINNSFLCRCNSWGCCNSCQSWFNIKYDKLTAISKEENSRNTQILWKLSCLLYPTTPAWNDTIQLVHHEEYPGQSSINVQPMIDMGPTNASCIYSTIHFVADQVKNTEWHLF